jgi:hypothetical protein
VSDYHDSPLDKIFANLKKGDKLIAERQPCPGRPQESRVAKFVRHSTSALIKKQNKPSTADIEAEQELRFRASAGDKLALKFFLAKNVKPLYNRLKRESPFKKDDYLERLSTQQLEMRSIERGPDYRQVEAELRRRMDPPGSILHGQYTAADVRVVEEAKPDRHSPEQQKKSAESAPGNTSNQGRIELGKTISVLYDELRRLKTFARGRRKTELDLRQQFPDFLLWKEIDTSSSLSPVKRKIFFESSLDSYLRPDFFNFIGNMVVLEGESAYKVFKEYRSHAGLKRKRAPSTAASKPIPKQKP